MPKKMQMILGQTNYLPHMIGQSYSAPKISALPMNKTANIFSLRNSMVDRVSSPRTGCGSCGK